MQTSNVGVSSGLVLIAAILELGGSHPNIVDIKIYTWQLFNGLYYLYKVSSIQEKAMYPLSRNGSATATSSRRTF